VPEQDGPAPADTEALTRKELRVLQLLAEGYSNSAMAEKLFVSDSTVRTHLRNINMKLGARSRTQAVAIARRLGLMR
jgi:LuxR family maltose regulon positive regulatory protein